jgi:CBS-domain-containing membrane protein
MYTRPAITIFDEDTALTLLRPFSDEYTNQIIVIHEDAYGEMVGILTPIEDLRFRLTMDNKEFDKMISKLLK